ncbi:TauD/TfdA family dioxygenase [uncultured Thiothrix sp.]|uniref:TauD/TfdA family dioxygenase n=1 Tax=uncultured Thiothrix sp. TaxID=223185 RepID=UPI0026025D68|nr:TauD/TfdA family dioxygenase [uncultured Thiothrix sp.]
MNLWDEEFYQRWREQKLALYPVDPSDLLVEIQHADAATPAELQQLKLNLKRYNFAFYRFAKQANASKQQVHQLAQNMGLKTLAHNLCADADSLTAIQVTQHQGQHAYIPYTDKKLSWHTDGYYNAAHEQIHGMLLHCVRPALQGGETQLMDHELAYLLLRNANCEYIHALQHPEAFTIPANILKDEEIRPAQTGSVFSFDADGHLHMRYSARQKNVIWRGDSVTQAAAQFLLDLWEQDSAYKLRYTLRAGEGLICNNVLHCRTAFVDAEEPEKKRLLYRGRYLERATS